MAMANPSLPAINPDTFPVPFMSMKTYPKNQKHPKHDAGIFPKGNYRLRCAERGWPVGWAEIGNELERRFVTEENAVVFRSSPTVELSLWQSELGPLRFEPVAA